MNRMLSVSISFTLLLLLAGACIPVDDLGEYWDTGTIDPAIEGHWKNADEEFRSQDHYISFTKSGDLYLVEFISADGPPNMRPARHQAKTLAWGKHKYLMYVDYP